MENKDLLTRPIEEISAKELSQLRSAIINELDSRQFRAKEEAWRKLTNAIKDYITTFGDIEVTTDYETFQISSIDDYSSIGEIHIKSD